VGGILESVCRNSDTRIRWGGDEFLILARQTAADQATVLAERILETISAHVFHVGNSAAVSLTCSIGLTTFPFVPGKPDLLGWERVIGIADRALYLAKNHGKAAWVGIFGTDESRQINPMKLILLIDEDPEQTVRRGIIYIRSSLEAIEGEAKTTG
jgi:predicted signal transduction protein with EAL and GGDEF domain